MSALSAAPAQSRRGLFAIELGLMAALGALQTLAFFRTGAWWLQLLCVAMLAWRVASATPGRAGWLGLAFGSAWLGAAVWWLFISLHRYGGLPAWFAVLAVVVLALALSSYLAVAMALVARWRCGKPWHDATLFAAAWLAAEWARTWVFTGFPWAASGYAHVDSPLAVLAPWIGVLGLGAVSAWLAAVLVGGRRRGLGVVVVALALGVPALTGGRQFSKPSGELSVSLLQTNVAQDEKFVARYLPDTLQWLTRALDSARGQLVLAPETAIPMLPAQLNELAPEVWPALVARFGAAQAGGQQARQAALVGVPLGDFDTGYSNSVVSFDAGPAGAEPYRYDKQHLVPFGEFIPTGFRWFTTLMNIPLGDFARGGRNPPSFVWQGQRIAPNVCYEDLFGEELALRFGDDATAPTIFANLTNIGWFGDTIAIDQHLNISRMRALEFQRPMLRATNTGATAIIDHRGRVTDSMAPFARGVLDGWVQGRSGITPFAWWSARAGLWPYVALFLAVFSFSAYRSAPGGRAVRP